ncbi:MAG: VWA domain-containing protein [Candidatus Lokiarchaeota archaeon]|nr:VWA domain-containing protein [Candidatus Lokiarchaeota archaeon]
MFVEYYYYLKERLPVSITEYMTLMEALNQGLIHNMVEFYYISRSILCKNEHHFDIYDIAFANFFKEAMVKFPEDIKQEIWDWLNKDITLPELIEGLQLLLREYQEYINIEDLEQFLEELLEKYGAEFGDSLFINAPNEIKDEIWKWLEKNLDLSEMQGNFQEMISQFFDLEEMQKRFEELLQKQDEEHNGGDHWIGTQGASPFGHGGQNPMGMRIGGSSGMRMAMQIAQKRIFKDYRKDIVLDTRQIKVALKRLKKLEEIGKKDELDLDKTIDKTAKNCGDIEIVFDKKRKNNVRMILLMDVGGSMTPYAHLVNLLFSAANNMSHWREFKYNYFHNCIYESIYLNARRNPEEAIDFSDFLRKFDNKYKVVIVGDAAMASWELTEKYGSIYYYHRNELPGIYYIKELANHFKNNIVWLNPELIRPEWAPWTRKIISSIIPMFDLTVEGIEEAMDYLRKGGKNMYTTVQMLKGLNY